MIEVTATMLPRTVINDRILEDQIASSAIIANSKILFIRSGDLLALIPVIHFDRVAVRHAADRVIRPRDHLVAGVEPGQDLEILVAHDSHLDRHELRLAVADGEYDFRLLARLSRLQLDG